MEKRYTLILGQNGTQIQLLEDGPLSPLLPGIFLTLHFALGLALNMALILGIVTTSTLSVINFNRLLLQFLLACTFDCFFNISAAVAFLAVTHLELSSKYAGEVVVACRLNASLMEWTALSQSAFLAALVADRVVALQHDSKTNNTSSSASSNSNFMIQMVSVLLWFYATAIVAPIAVTSSIVDTSFFPYRYSCGVVPNSEGIEDLVYPLLLLVLGYIVPWTVTSISSLKVLRHILATRRRRRLLEEAGLTRSQRLQEATSWTAGLAWDEVTFYWLVSVLLLCFILLLLPHDLYVNILPLTLSSTTGASKEDSSTEISKVLTGSLDCVLVWCRYSFTVVAPLTILVVHKEVRKSCEHLFCCCRGNSVVNLDDARSISACVQKRIEQEVKNKTSSLKRVRTRKDKYARAASYRTPVLFATSEGLHLRLVDDAVTRVFSKDNTQQLSSEPQFICEFCDVAILTPTPIENAVKPSNSLQQSFVARRPKPQVFTPEVLPEEDMHVTDSSGEYPTRVLPLPEEHDALRRGAFRSNNNNNHNCSNKNYRKPPRVRFAQTVSEIPLSESGVWSAPEDHNVVLDQSHFGKRLSPAPS